MAGRYFHTYYRWCKQEQKDLPTQTDMLHDVHKCEDCGGSTIVSTDSWGLKPLIEKYKESL
jgi:hypothetical protein